MLAFNSELFSWLACRFRSRADLELEVIALRHQLAVLRRQRPGRMAGKHRYSQTKINRSMFCSRTRDRDLRLRTITC